MVEGMKCPAIFLLWIFPVAPLGREGVTKTRMGTYTDRSGDRTEGGGGGE